MAEEKNKTQHNHTRSKQSVTNANEEKRNQQRQRDVNQRTQVSEEQLVEQKLRRRNIERNRLANMTEQQIIERRERRREQQHQRLQRMSEEQLAIYRERRREQERVRRQRNREIHLHNMRISCKSTQTTVTKESAHSSMVTQSQVIDQQMVNQKSLCMQPRRNQVARMTGEQLIDFQVRRYQLSYQRWQQNRDVKLQSARAKYPSSRTIIMEEGRRQCERDQLAQTTAQQLANQRARRCLDVCERQQQNRENKLQSTGSMHPSKGIVVTKGNLVVNDHYMSSLDTVGVISNLQSTDAYENAHQHNPSHGIVHWQLPGVMWRSNRMGSCVTCGISCSCCCWHSPSRLYHNMCHLLCWISL